MSPTSSSLPPQPATHAAQAASTAIRTARRGDSGAAAPETLLKYSISPPLKFTRLQAKAGSMRSSSYYARATQIPHLSANGEPEDSGIIRMKRHSNLVVDGGERLANSVPQEVAEASLRT